MLQIGNTLISLDLVEEKFVCDLSACKGQCCVEGDSGAPITKEELEIIESILPIIKKMLPKENLKLLKYSGSTLIDEDDELVTNTFPNKGACVFCLYDKNNIAYCAFEKAWNEGKIDFRKPISCHLYPVRISKYKDFDAVNVHFWHICNSAIAKGRETGTPVYVFLKDALIRKYGETWYSHLVEAAESLGS
ncbi:MAG: DUF3109 family protein [Bacteroidales bacterium]|nr:DUF3109 family protein [Bacteroidales bacterium]